MTTLLISHPSFLGHETPDGHPERADRIRAVEAALAGEAFDLLKRESAPRSADEDILRVHPQSYIDRLKALSPQSGLAFLDGDTCLSPGTVEAIYRATGAVLRSIDAVAGKEVTNAFVIARPPGHHAETSKAMGFCFFNHVAIGARYAQARHGFAKIAIVDWDVHHGNGTEEIFWSDASVLYCSTHQSPLYPGTGAATDRGEKDTIVNIQLHEGTGSADFRDAFRSGILPRVAAFAPDLILISAGFDAHNRDPLGGLLLTEADFAWATLELAEIARGCCDGRIVSLLEGGYDLRGLAASAAAHVKALMSV